MTDAMISLHRNLNESTNVLMARLRSQKVSFESWDFSESAVIKAEDAFEKDTMAFWDLVQKEYGDIIGDNSVSANWDSEELVIRKIKKRGFLEE